MSNNVRDYLSVERISIKEMEDSLLAHKSKLLKHYRISNLLGFKESPKEQPLSSYHSADIRKEEEHPKSPAILRRHTKFKPPFQLYHYRDFMWKVAFSNGLVVEPLEEYEGRLRVYVGPGNNSNLLRGILRRRPWWTITDKAHDASFVWTQIKVGALFGQQKGGRLPAIAEDSPLPAVGRPSSNPLLNPIERRKWDHYWRVNVDR
jgi:hypothetical protein